MTGGGTTVTWKKAGTTMQVPARSRTWPFHAVVAAGMVLCLSSCQTARHQFTPPAADWQTKSGQLQYGGPKTMMIGEVLIRFSKRGDFELTFTKGPGIVLLTVRQDPEFVRVSGPLARGSWSGPPAGVPQRLRGWTELRDLLMGMRDQHVLRHTSGADTFLFEF